jgi:pyruvate dehydrogenase phosphatase
MQSITDQTTPISDDLTVEVIFFGESANTGSVSINEEASAMAENAKPKL